jgi:hypothetical protein
VRDFRVAEMKKIRDQWLGCGTMSIMVYSSFLVLYEGKVLENSMIWSFII